MHMIKKISGSLDISLCLKHTSVSNHISHDAFKDTATA